MEDENAVTEIADRRSDGAWIRLDHDRIEALPSPPHGNEAGITKDLPAIGIGDVERQAAIGETLVGRVHPVALDGRGADIDVVAVDDMGDELHVVPGFTGRRGTPP